MHSNPSDLVIIDRAADYLRSAMADPASALVDLESCLPGIRLDVRYASAANVVGEPLYPRAQAWLRRPAAAALAAVQADCAERGLGLVVYDAYRPYRVTIRLWEAVGDARYVADPRVGSRHNRGCAVDLSLVDLTSGRPLAMPTDYDDFSVRAHQGHADLPPEAIANRELLKSLMERHGFSAFATEWWHFDFAGWERFDLLDLDFDHLPRLG